MPPNNQQLPNQPTQSVPEVGSPPAILAPEPQQAANMNPYTQSGGQTGQVQEPPENVKKAANQTTSQRSLMFSELRDSMIIMNDGSFRVVIECESINFDLMSAREREGVEYSYQNFLNSLFFPIQILVRSRRVDIAPYLEKLDTLRQSEDNMLLNVLMEDYIDFVAALAENANIMDKTFHIIIPYHPSGDASKLLDDSRGFFSRIFGNRNTSVIKINKQTYEKAKEEISNRIETVVNGLYQVGIQAKRLNTKELGELYYNSYNPDTAVNQPLSNFGDATATYVKKGVGESPRSTMGGGV